VALTFTNWNFDAASYAPGATVTLTVNYSSTNEVAASDVANAVTVTLSDASGALASQSSDASGNFPEFTVSTPANAAEPVTVSASPGTWTVVSNAFAAGGPPFEGTAVLTSVA
jgi:hypothetical protein